MRKCDDCGREMADELLVEWRHNRIRLEVCMPCYRGDLADLAKRALIEAFIDAWTVESPPQVGTRDGLGSSVGSHCQSSSE